jgi:3-oxoadipate enol-lactonase
MKTHYALDGPAGAPVVTLSHPLGATHALWDRQAPVLLPRYRTLLYDVRGHGRSEAPPGPYTLEEMAGDVVALLDTLRVEATHFVGLSMGGLIGMTLALAHPARVRSLVLCDTTACYGEGLRPMWEERIRIAESAGMTETLIDKTMDIWFSPGFRRDARATVDRVAAMLRATDPRAYAAAIRAIAFVDLLPRLDAIRCPTFVVVGEDDPGTTPAMARAIHTRIPDAHLLVLPGARHCSVVESADRFNAALAEFLHRVRR